MSEMRCRDCQELGLECPQGYHAGVMECDVCGHRVVAAMPACSRPSLACPRCYGTLTYIEIDEEDNK